MNLNERIEQLESQVKSLTSKLSELSESSKQTPRPYSVVGGIEQNSSNHPIDISTGMSGKIGGFVIFNNSELLIPPFNTEPPLPTIGYNKHSHSRYSGGALIKGVSEIVEYDLTFITNPHCQQFLTEEQIEIVKDINTKGETVEKVGILDLVFNADTLTWGTPAYEIDIKKCYLIERDENGDIVLDSKGQQKKSPLYNEDSTKTAIAWDENAACFRFFASYAPGV